MKIPLSSLAYTRSGDKGDGSNVGVVAYSLKAYELLRTVLTSDRVKRHFHAILSLAHKHMLYGKLDLPAIHFQ